MQPSDAQRQKPRPEGLVIGRRDKVYAPIAGEVQETAQARASFSSMAKLQKRELQWAGIMERLQKGEQPKSDMKSLIRKGGIPAAHRGAVWLYTCGAKTKQAASPTAYRDILRAHEGESSAAIKQIEKDLGRTLPPNIRSPEVLGSLRRVLVAYSWLDPEVGYCQSMNFVVALLLLFMGEEEAFWMTVMIVEKLAVGYYSKTMLGVIADARLFCDLIGQKIPKLASHVHKFNVDMQSIAIRWFLCLFVNIFPLETSLRFFDFLFLEGDKMLFRFALALLKCYEKNLLQAQTFEVLFQQLNKLPETATNVDALLEQAYDPIWMGSFPRSKLQKGREAILEVLQTEKKRFIDEAQRQSVGPVVVSPPLSPRISNAVQISPRSPRGTHNSDSRHGSAIQRLPLQSMPNLGHGEERPLSPHQAGLPTGTIYVSVPKFLLGDEVAILAERQLGDNDLMCVAAELERDITAQQLILDGNAFGPDGVQVLARALSRNNTLTKLLLSRNTIGDEGAAALGGAITRTSRLKVVSLANCGISDMGALALLRGVEESQVLETLVIAGNPKLSNLVAQKLLALLDAKPAFRYVEAAGTGFSEDMQSAIAAAQERTERRMMEKQQRSVLDHRTAPAWLSFSESRFFWLVPGVNHLGRPEACETDMALARDQLRLEVNGTAVTVVRIGNAPSYLKHSDDHVSEIPIAPAPGLGLADGDHIYFLKEKYRAEFVQNVP